MHPTYKWKPEPVKVWDIQVGWEKFGLKGTKTAVERHLRHVYSDKEVQINERPRPYTFTFDECIEGIQKV